MFGEKRKKKSFALRLDLRHKLYLDSSDRCTDTVLILMIQLSSTEFVIQ